MPLIGFLIYAAFVIFMEICKQVINLLGSLHITEFVSSLMSVVTPIVNILVSVLQLLISVGVPLLNALLPVILFIIRLVFLYISIQVRVWEVRECSLVIISPPL